MKKIADLNSSKYTVVGILVAIFIVMFVFNCMTPYLADDYVYIFSFVDAKPIEKVGQIVPSMIAHSHVMNGRVISHGFEQLFMITPKVVFNAVNAFVFAMCGYLVYRICMEKKKHNAAVCALIFAAMWYFVPSFGQVFLWQVGSVNYAWALLTALLFIYPYIDSYKNKTPFMKNTALFVLFNAFAFVVGMYSEVSSFVAIASAVCVTAISCIEERKMPQIKKVLPIVFAIAGFIVLLKMPVELTAKLSGNIDIGFLISNFALCTKNYVKFFGVPFVIWAAQVVLGVLNKKRQSNTRLILSVIFVLLSLGANYVMIIGAYIAERSLFMAAIMIVAAVFTAANEPLEGKKAFIMPTLAVLLCVVTSVSFVFGAYDIYRCGRDFYEREEYILDAKAQGVTDIEAEVIYPNTRHCAFWGITDLAKTNYDYPNPAVSLYYGINSIIGK